MSYLNIYICVYIRKNTTSDVEVMNIEKMWFHKVWKLELMKISARKGVNICVRMYVLHGFLANTITSMQFHSAADSKLV